MEKFKYFVDAIFPVPVYYSYDVKNFTKSELDSVEKHREETYENAGNITSNNTYILETKPFEKLKNILLDHVNEYLKVIHAPENKDLKLYITQSWLNYTNNNQFHHAHSHQNSFISGVLYIKANENVDSISFAKTVEDSVRIISKNYGIFNSSESMKQIKTGMLILFPSSLTHGVEIKKDNEERISLAFNTYFKGTLGSAKSLTELKL